MEYDTVVVGAGPAGSVTAAAVAHAGYRVLVLEKNASCRSPCAGYVSNTININLPDDSIIQSKITKMRTYFPDLSFHDFELNGFVVDRPLFDMSLVMRAIGSGAEIKWSSALTEISAGTIKFHHESENDSVTGKIIVGADGVFSKTAALLGLHQQGFAVCAQYHLKGIGPIPGMCEIIFNTEYAPGGYVWIYPTGEDSAKVGVGITKGKSPRTYLDDFINNSPVAKRLDGTKTEYITGALPIAGLRERLSIGNILLAGDSAGMADPVTGAGINNAMLAGEMAGEAIIKALANDDLGYLTDYEVRIKKLLGRPLTRSLEKRKRLEACTSNELLQEHLPEVWVTFKQYWE